MLVEENRTVSDTGLVEFTDDDFFGYIVEAEKGPALWELITGGIAIALIAGMIGFVVAMRTNKGFNRVVSGALPKALSSNNMLRQSLGMFDQFEELAEADKQYLNETGNQF